MEFVDIEWFGNSIFNYLYFLACILGGIILGKIFSWVSTNIIKKVVGQTKTMLDDIIVHSIDKPLVFLLFTVGFWLGSTFLILSDSVQSTFDNIISILITWTVAWFIMNILDALIVNYLKPAAEKSETDLDDTLIPIVRKAIKVIVVTLAIILIIDNFGYDVTSLIAGLGLGGLAFALAAQDLLKNLFGGIAILTDKPFKLGERIRIDGNDGWIREIGLRTTRMETLDGTMIVIPNSKIADSVLENVSKEKARKVKVKIGLTYDTSSAKVAKAKKIITDIIKENKDTKDDSLVSFYNFADSSLEILVIYWIHNFDNLLGARDHVNTQIKKRFEKAGIEMAFPTTTVYIKK